MSFSDIFFTFIVPIAAILFWLSIYIYDCVKLHRTPSFFKSIRENWWAYALAIITITIVLFQLKSCTSEIYDRGYKNGYDAGIEEGISRVREDPAAYFDW